MTPIVSWIVPVASGEKWLDRCLKSIVNQTYNSWEALIIINGQINSNEYSKIKIKYSKFKNKIFFYELKKRGLANALNFGLKKCKGEWIARLDADDYCIKQRLEIQMNYTSYDLIFSNVDYVDEKEKKLYSNKLLEKIYYNKKTFFEIIHSYFIKMLSKYPNKISVSDELSFRNPIPHSSVLIRKSILIKVGGYSSNQDGNNPCQDLKTWHLLKDINCKFYIVDKILTYISIHPHQITASKEARYECAQINYIHFKKNKDYRSLVASIYQLILSLKTSKRYD